MPAVTETANTRQEWVIGNKRAVIAALTSVDNSDTWASGLTLLEFVTFTPTTVASIAITTSAGTATFVVNQGSNIAGQVLAIGV